jgi:SAM-dependent methyltransferase
MSNYVTNEKYPHLGGNFAEGDPACFSASAFKYCLDNLQIKTVMDVGSGQGHTSKWFVEQGCEVTAVEGLPENVENAVVPTIQHDLVNGPYIKPVDLTVCIEVVEHVDQKYVSNLIDTLTNGKWILMTHAVPGQRGWHHVNCQPTEYWTDLLGQKGYSIIDTHSKQIQILSKKDGAKHIARNGFLFGRQK